MGNSPRDLSWKTIVGNSIAKYLGELFEKHAWGIPFHFLGKLSRNTILETYLVENSLRELSWAITLEQSLAKLSWKTISDNYLRELS